MKIGVAACAGGYGQKISQSIQKNGSCTLSGGTVRSSNPYYGKDLSSIVGGDLLNIKISDDTLSLFENSDAVIEFSSPNALLENLKIASQTQTAYVTGNTGLTKDHFDALNQAALSAPILWAPNMSLGATLLSAMTQMLAKKLDLDFDIEIMDMHHGGKVDAPSGTALHIGQKAAEARNLDFDKVSQVSRNGHTGPRKKGDIGFASLRGGSVFADCTVIFAGAGERIELTHRADNGQIFADGAVKAALWLKDKKPGLYSMYDVLGL